MNRARAFAEFWSSFLLGDDWRLTAGLILAICSTLLLGTAGLSAWWLLPAAVALLLTQSLRRATRK
jgi:hypothetical protein